MKYFLPQLLVLFLCSGLYSQNSAAEKKIKSTIHTFFEGLHHGDTILIKRTIHKDLKLQTTFVNQEGKSVLRTQAKSDFLKSIAAKNPSDVWLEKLRSFDVKIDGNLASVWTPYEFYVNNKFSHCGTNSFQLFNNNGTWEIIFIVDTRNKQGCK